MPKKRMTEEEWALFTSIYDEGVDNYRLSEDVPDDPKDPRIKLLESIRDKLYSRVAP